MTRPDFHRLAPAVIRGLLDRLDDRRGDGHADGERTCLSLYLPTHPAVPGNTVDQPTYRGLVAELRRGLAAGRRRDQVERLLEPFLGLAEDRGFWQHARSGLAILAADGHADGFVLPVGVPPRAVVAPRFHLFPLLELACGCAAFRLLLLTSREARLYDGTAVDGRVAGLAPARLPAEAGPQAAAGRLCRDDVVAAEPHEPHRSVRLDTGWAVLHGGFGSRQDELDNDTVTFLRHVARQVDEAGNGAAPLVLAAAPPLAGLFRRFCRVPGMLERGIDKDLHLEPEAALADHCGGIVQSLAAGRAADRLAAFLDARGHGRGSGDLRDIGRAAVAGRIATLIVERERIEPGSFDRATGEIRLGAAKTDAGGAGEEIVSAIGETVFLHDGEIATAAPDSLPTNCGMAALYRW